MKKIVVVILLLYSFSFSTSCSKKENEDVNVNQTENERENVNVNNTVDENEREHSFFGKWYISKAVLTSELYTGTTLDGLSEEDLYNPEDFLGFELEYSNEFVRLGDSIYYHPIYHVTDTSVREYNRGSRVQAPNLDQFIEEEDIAIENEDTLVQFDVTFDSEIKYEQYDFIPVGTQCVLLNENSMLVGLWGKILLAYRQM